MHSSFMRLSAVAALLLCATVAVPARATGNPVQRDTWQVIGAAASLPTLYRPAGLAVDPGGNVYVADTGNYRVVRLGPDGRMLGHFGEADLRPRVGAPSGGEVQGPPSLAVSGGRVYVADAPNDYVRVFEQGHLVDDWPIQLSGATLAGMAVAVERGGTVVLAVVARVTCPGSCAEYYVVQRRSPSGALLSEFHSPIGQSGSTADPEIIERIAVAVDSRSDIFVARQSTLDCYKSCPEFETLVEHAPDGREIATWGGLGSSALPFITALAVGGRDNLFLADLYSGEVQKRDSHGRLVTRWIVRSPSGSPAQLQGIAIDRSGNVYVADGAWGRVVKLSPGGRPLTGWSAGGNASGRFWFPGDLALDGHGGMWVADVGNARVQHLSLDGRPLFQFPVPGLGRALALDARGSIYVSQTDRGAVFICKFSPQGRLLARWTHFHFAEAPEGLAVTRSGNIVALGLLYFPAQAGQPPQNGTYLLTLGPGGHERGRFTVNHSARVVQGGGVAVDSAANMYVVYGSAPRVEKWSPNGTLLASRGSYNGVRETTPGAGAISLDASGNVYVAKTPSSRILEFTPSLAPMRIMGFPGSYPGQFHHPAGIAATNTGMIVVADTDNHRIQEIQL